MISHRLAIILRTLLQHCKRESQPYEITFFRFHIFHCCSQCKLCIAHTIWEQSAPPIWPQVSARIRKLNIHLICRMLLQFSVARIVQGLMLQYTADCWSILQIDVIQSQEVMEPCMIVARAQFNLAGNLKSYFGYQMICFGIASPLMAAEAPSRSRWIWKWLISDNNHTLRWCDCYPCEASIDRAFCGESGHPSRISSRSPHRPHQFGVSFCEVLIQIQIYSRSQI